MVQEKSFRQAQKAAYSEVCGFLRDGYRLVLEHWQESDMFGLIKLHHGTNRNKLLIRIQNYHWSVYKNGKEIK